MVYKKLQRGLMNKIFKTKNLPANEIIRFWTAMKLAGKESMLFGFEKQKGSLIYYQNGNHPFVRFVPSKQFYSRFFPTKKTITLNKLIELCLSKEQ